MAGAGMTGVTGFNRRGVLAVVASSAALALAGCATRNSAERRPALTMERQILTDQDGGETELIVWSPPDPRGVVLFSADAGSRPERYRRTIERLAGIGLAVAAPLHDNGFGALGAGAGAGGNVGSGVVEERSLARRVAGLALGAAFASTRFAGLPLLAMGHGLGGLAALAFGREQSGPEVRGVLTLSAADLQHKLVSEDLADGRDVPLLMVAGNGERGAAAADSRDGDDDEGADAAPRPADEDKADELLTAANGNAHSYALVLEDVDENFVDQPEVVERAWPVVELFVQSELLNGATAGDVLENWQADGNDRFVARPASD